ncbi:MAG: hypothetical protein ACKJRP_04290 [SAR86 cluster bacterium]|tara:strand:+ start:15548 stop:16774 length:1227 start_codon:yes stop_codon:yes gene_type:complete
MTINSEAELLKSFGRFGDNYLAHIGGGERVLPPRGVLPESVDRDIRMSMQEVGLDPDRYTVGSDANSINPVTGQPEFFLGSILKGAFGGRKDTTAYQRAQQEEQRRAFTEFDQTPGYYNDPFGSATADRSGLSAQFQPDQQNIFDRWGRFGTEADAARTTRMDEMNRLFGGGPFQGEIDDYLKTSMEQGGREVDYGATNAMSKLFNVGGMSTGTTAQFADLERRREKTLADLKRDRFSNWLGLREGYQGSIRDFESDIGGYSDEQGKMIERLRKGLTDARLWSKDLTDLDWEKMQGRLIAQMENARALDERRAAKKSGWERWAPFLDVLTADPGGLFNTAVADAGGTPTSGVSYDSTFGRFFTGAPGTNQGGGAESLYTPKYGGYSAPSRGGSDMYNPLNPKLSNWSG